MRQILLSFAVTLGALLLVAALFSPIYFYSGHCKRRPNPERRIPVILYVVFLFIAAVIGFFVGLIEGAEWACSPPSFGNLCGLFGVFIAGPAVAALAVAGSGSLILLVRSDLPGDRAEGEMASSPVQRWG